MVASFLQRINYALFNTEQLWKMRSGNLSRYTTQPLAALELQIKMMTQKLTVELPEPVFQLLVHMAALTEQSPEQLAAQSIAGNLPPSVENTPPEIQAELL